MKKFLLLAVLAGSVITSYGMNKPALDEETIRSMSIPELRELVAIHSSSAYSEQAAYDRILDLAQQELKQTGMYPNISTDYLSIDRERKKELGRLIDAIKNDSLEKWQEKFSNINGRQWINTILDIAPHQTTLLGKAVEKNRSGIVEFLLDRGADANARINRQGETALMLAAEQGNLHLVQLLLSHGASPVVATYQGGHLIKNSSQGKTAVWFAKKKGHADIAELLNNYIKERNDIVQTHMSADPSELVGQYLGEPEKVKKPKHRAAEDAEAAQ